MTSQERRGRFVVLEGLDGSGKTTQAKRLVAALTRADRPAPLHLREPGSTPLGEALRELLLDGRAAATPGAEALLFAAARRQMLDEVVGPALAAGRDVVCERFNGSTFAYQAVAGGLDERAVLALLETWCGAPAPDVELLLRIDADVARARRGADRDAIEARGAGFQRRVAEGLDRWARLHPRVRIVDAARDADAIACDVLAEVERAHR